MDEGASSAAGLRNPVPGDAVPFGFAVRHSPADSVLVWHDVARLDDGRFVVAVGHCPDVDTATSASTAVMAALRNGTDPARALDAMTVEGAAVACGVIDREAATLTCSTAGDAIVALASPDHADRTLQHLPGRTVTAAIPPGATVLFSSGGVPGLVAPLAESACTAALPDAAIDHLLARVRPPANPGLVALVYRQAPDPMDITLPAEPKSLAAVRASLRPWLSQAGVDAEPAADVLLAVGEAASNSAEHAVLGATGTVDLTVRAVLNGDRLRMTVSDNGTWKPATTSPSHRGHGIKLINALVDTADLTTTENGTTVDMLKELRR